MNDQDTTTSVPHEFEKSGLISNLRTGIMCRICDQSRDAAIHQVSASTPAGVRTYATAEEFLADYNREAEKAATTTEALPPERIWIDIRPIDVSRFEYSGLWYGEKPRNPRYTTGVAEYILRSLHAQRVAELKSVLLDCVLRMEKLRELLAISGARDSQVRILDTSAAREKLEGNGGKG